MTSKITVKTDAFSLQQAQLRAKIFQTLESQLNPQVWLIPIKIYGIVVDGMGEFSENSDQDAAAGLPEQHRGPSGGEFGEGISRLLRPRLRGWLFPACRFLRSGLFCQPSGGTGEAARNQ
jgi:hypothetical protein